MQRNIKHEQRANTVNRARGIGSIILMTACAGFAQASAVEVVVERSEAVYRVDGQFTTATPAAIVWDVLTDYDHIDEFVSSMAASDVVEHHADGRFRVNQRARIGVFPFRRWMKVGLLVEEHEPRRIEFRDVLNEDFRDYGGSWSLAEDSSGTTVRYMLTTRLRVAVPGFVGGRMLRSNVTKLLSQVMEEMERRAAAQPAASAVHPPPDSLARATADTTLRLEAHDRVGWASPGQREARALARTKGDATP